MSNEKEITNSKNNNGQGSGGFLKFLLIIACSLAFIPAVFIPWNRTEWVDDWHYYEYSSGFFLRALKIILIAISVITWIWFLYIKYQSIVNNQDNDSNDADA